MGISPVELGPYTDGVNLVDATSKLASTELSVCTNFRIGIRGDFYKRPGHDWYGTSPAKANGDNKGTFVARYYKSDGSKKLLAAANGKLKYGNDSTGAWTAININGTDANMSTTQLADWMVYKDRIYICDGTNPQRYNGTDDIYAGHPTIVPTLNAQASGGVLPNGTYKYVVTAVAGDMGEGPISTPLTVTVTSSANNKVTINIPDPVLKHEVTIKRVYRTIAGGSTYKLLADVAYGVPTYVDQSILDTQLGTDYVPVHAPPNDCKFVIMGHDDRAYWFGRVGVNASLVDVSDVGFPDRIKDLDFFSVANNDGDIITGGGLTPGGTVFFKKNSMWLLRAYGYGLQNIAPKEKKGAGLGTISPFSIVTTPIGLIFLSQRGEIYRFDGTNLEEIGRRVASEFAGLPTTTANNVIACYHDYRYIISYDYRGQKGYNWRTLEYDTIGRKWEGPHENGDAYNPAYYSVWDSNLDAGELYWIEAKAANGSYVYKRNEFSKTDRGTRFASTLRTGRNNFAKLGEVRSYKLFIEGEFTPNAELTASHIDLIGTKTSVRLGTTVSFTASKLNGTDNLGGGSAPVIKLGGSNSSILEGPLDPSARDRLPMYEITDGGSSYETKFRNLSLLVGVLDPK